MYRRLVCSIAGLTLLAAAACSQASSSFQPSPSDAAKATVRPKAANDLVYVNELAGPSTVNVYSGDPRMQVGSLDVYAYGIATDSAGHLYVSNKDQVWVFDSGAKKLIRTLTRNLNKPGLLAVSPNGTLYVQDQRGVAIFPNGKQNRMKRIKLRDIYAMTTDSQNNLYVATGDDVVYEYVYGTTSPSRTITKGVDGTYSMVVDSSGNLYVASVASSGSGGGSVTVYAPDATSPMQTITPADGVYAPIALAFDGSGNLYVANYGNAQTSKSSVTVYSPGNLALVRTISAGMSAPRYIAVDGAGKLYVGNQTTYQDYGNVTVYAAGSTKLVQTISDSRATPLGFAVGK